MSKQRMTNSNAAKYRVNPTARRKGLPAGAKRREPEVVDLEIDDSDFGGDPYNHTGSHCVLKCGEDA